MLTDWEVTFGLIRELADPDSQTVLLVLVRSGTGSSLDLIKQRAAENEEHPLTGERVEQVLQRLWRLCLAEERKTGVWGPTMFAQGLVMPINRAIRMLRENRPVDYRQMVAELREGVPS
jgi:hypothetical protein